jgi:hypothetical protein
MDVVSLKGEVHNKLINRIVDFVFAIIVVIHNPVELGLWVGND